MMLVLTQRQVLDENRDLHSKYVAAAAQADQYQKLLAISETRAANYQRSALYNEHMMNQISKERDEAVQKLLTFQAQTDYARVTKKRRKK